MKKTSAVKKTAPIKADTKFSIELVANVAARLLQSMKSAEDYETAARRALKLLTECDIQLRQHMVRNNALRARKRAAKKLGFGEEPVSFNDGIYVITGESRLQRATLYFKRYLEAHWDKPDVPKTSHYFLAIYKRDGFEPHQVIALKESFEKCVAQGQLGKIKKHKKSSCLENLKIPVRKSAKATRKMKAIAR